MNLLLLDECEVQGDAAVLGGRRAEHVARVIGARPGDRLRVGIARRGVGQAVVVRAEPSRLELSIGEIAAAPPVPPVDLVLALPRPKAVARVVQTAACLGVRRVDLVNAWRVDKTYFSSRRLAPEALARELRLGCEQGAHTYVPDIAVHALLMPLVRDDLAARATSRRILVFDPRASEPLEHIIRPGDDAPVVALVGPEGGWIDRELEAFEQIGGTPASLGARVLRSEVAVASALAQLELLRRLGPATQ